MGCRVEPGNDYIGSACVRPEPGCTCLPAYYYLPASRTYLPASASLTATITVSAEGTGIRSVGRGILE